MSEHTVSYLSRLANAVEALVEVIKEQASTERTVTLEPVLAGPAVGDPIGYAVVQPMGLPVGHYQVLVDFLEPTLAAASMICEPNDGQRIVVAYDLPEAVSHD